MWPPKYSRSVIWIEVTRGAASVVPGLLGGSIRVPNPVGTSGGGEILIDGTSTEMVVGDGSGAGGAAEPHAAVSVTRSVSVRPAAILPIVESMRTRTP